MDPLMLGRRLRAARISSGFDDPDYFAKLLGVPSASYRSLESGRPRGSDLLGLLAMVAQVTNHSLDFLVCGRERKTEPSQR